MALRIVQYNDSILRKKGEKIVVFDEALRELASAMILAMQAAGGIGLAAQQVGQAKLLCVVDLRESDAEFTWKLDGVKPPRDLFMPVILANPKITVLPGTTETVYEEGCLSFPEIRGDVSRPDEIEVRYQDDRGVAHTLICDGLLARCVQHEFDHLQGILFIDRMPKKIRAELNDAIKALAKGTKEDNKAAGQAARG